MDEQELQATLEEMTQRRRDAVLSRARADIALRILEQRGSVTADEVTEAIGQLPAIDERSLADQVAAKASAGIAATWSALESGREAVDGATAKVRKCEALLEASRSDREEALANLDWLQQQLAEARELAEFAAGLGDASAAPAPESQVARAQVATGEGSAT